MVPDARCLTSLAGLDNDQVETDRQPRQRCPVRQLAPIEQPVCGEAQTRPFPVVDGLLAKPEAPRCPPAHLHDDEIGRRTRVDRHEIELMAADMDVPGQDGPTGLEQSDEDQRFGGVTCLLCLGPCRDADRAFHGPMVTTLAALARIGGCTAR